MMRTAPANWGTGSCRQESACTMDQRKVEGRQLSASKHKKDFSSFSLSSTFASNSFRIFSSKPTLLPHFGSLFQLTHLPSVDNHQATSLRSP